MGVGATIPPVSTAGRYLAAPADTVPRTTVRILIPQVRGASTATPSIGARKPAPVAVCPLTTMPTTAIPTEAGQNTTKRSIAEQRPVRLAAIPTMSTATIGIPTQTVFAMIAAQMSR